MKIIFLDIDGVLNSEASMIRKGKFDFFNDNPDPEHIKWLNLIIEKTGAQCVISSTWRNGCSSLMMWRFLYLLGFKGKIIGNTPRLSDSYRGTEIKAWLNEHEDKETKYKDYPEGSMCRIHMGKVESFVILDDDSDMVDLMPHLVEIDGRKGLTEEDALKAIEILNRV